MMGTNFYIDGQLLHDRCFDELLSWDGDNVHIGKRSSAGAWCFDCDCPMLYTNTSADPLHLGPWKCGICGEISPKPLMALRFTWAISPPIFSEIVLQEDVVIGRACIVDEYGHKLTFEQFLLETQNTRIYDYSCIGMVFT